jgi:hypothetical protein
MGLQEPALEVPYFALRRAALTGQHARPVLSGQASLCVWRCFARRTLGRTCRLWENAACTSKVAPIGRASSLKPPPVLHLSSSTQWRGTSLPVDICSLFSATVWQHLHCCLLSALCSLPSLSPPAAGT